MAPQLPPLLRWHDPWNLFLSYGHIVKIPELQLVCFSKVPEHKWI